MTFCLLASVSLLFPCQLYCYNKLLCMKGAPVCVWCMSLPPSDLFLSHPPRLRFFSPCSPCTEASAHRWMCSPAELVVISCLGATRAARTALAPREDRWPWVGAVEAAIKDGPLWRHWSSIRAELSWERSNNRLNCCCGGTASPQMAQHHLRPSSESYQEVLS